MEYKYVAIDHSIDKNYYGDTLISCVNQFTKIKTTLTETGFKLEVTVDGYKSFNRYYSKDYTQLEAESDCLMVIANTYHNIFPNYSIYTSI